jgi:hypothetical protein
MNRMGFVLGWVLAGIVGATLLVLTFSHAFPFAAVGSIISAQRAEEIGLQQLTVLGPPVKDAYLVASRSGDVLLERWMETALESLSMADLRATGLPDQLGWNVYVYDADRRREEWTYLATLSSSGRVVGLSYRMDPDAKATSISHPEARQRADAFLKSRGVDLARYGEPQMRVRTLASRTDLTVRYPAKRPVPGGLNYGLDVDFAGDRLAGYSPWYENPGNRIVQKALQPILFMEVVHTVIVYLLAGFTAFFFLRRYHEGLIGVGRGVQVFTMVFAAGFLVTLIQTRQAAQGFGFGFATRQQTTWAWFTIVLVFYCLPSALLAFFAWSVGESVLRERWGAKLAAFDALFQRQWANATVARSALAGPMAGLLAAGLFTSAFVALRPFGMWVLTGGANDWGSGLPGLEELTSFIGLELPLYLATLLFILPLTIRYLGRPAGFIVAALVGILTLPMPTTEVPFSWFVAITFVFALLVLSMLRWTDLLSTLLAGMTFNLLIHCYSMLAAPSAALKIQGVIAIVGVAVPFALSARSLMSNREFTYRYEDVPPHVRRIADRERQRVELETARGIQSAILPDLPPELAGVQLAHAYLPASEVGGDFYDVLALEDGRLAISVGDVAGHGVSSGLVMSMAKSALAVQVTFNPDVLAVFETLNRTIYQTARKRLLTTLIYALLDPQRKELRFASAGHLFPYRIGVDGKVDALESTGYPLGVRHTLDVKLRTVRLAPGDTLFLFSDGLVEARAEASDDLFGFDRLEDSLSRHANDSVEQLRDSVLGDITRFTRNAPREDDQTVLVLRLPGVM